MRRLLVGLIITASISPATAGAEAPGRLYLLASDDGRLAWSVDPLDPELRAPSVDRTCFPAVAVPVPPCRSGAAGGAYTSNLYFLPQSRLDEDVEVSPAKPMTFRFGLDVELPVAFSVRLAVEQTGGVRLESGPAAEVAPGVWQGELTTPAQLRASRTTYLGLRIRYEQATPVVNTGPPARIRLQTAGESWVEPAAPVAARSVARLVADAPPVAAPQRFESLERTIDFNDGEWEALRFDGTLAAAATYPITLPRDAETMTVWLEPFAKPVGYSLGKAETDARPPTDSYTMSVTREDGTVGQGFGFSALDVQAGSMTLRVAPITGARPRAYTAWVLFTFGKRTIAGMRWSVQVNTASHQSPITGSCAASLTSIPVTDAATTYAIALSVDSPNPSVRWAINWSIPNFGGYDCGSTTFSRLRVTAPPDNVVAIVSAAPSRESLGVSAFDAMAVFDARLTYSSP